MWSKKDNGALDEEVITTLMHQAYGVQLEKHRQEALAQAEIDNDQRLLELRAREREMYQERLAEYEADVEADVDSRVAQQLQQIRADLDDQYGEQVASLSAALAEEKRRRELAESAVLALVESLTPTPGKSYALARHCQVCAVPLEALNTILARAGQRLAGLVGGSGHRIACGHYEYSALVRQTPESGDLGV
jgi:hypothetical protein